MVHSDRGVYEPNGEVCGFDDSEDDDDIEGSRLPLLIVLALLVLAMYVGVVWLTYMQGVAHGRAEASGLTAQSAPAQAVTAQAPARIQAPKIAALTPVNAAPVMTITIPPPPVIKDVKKKTAPVTPAPIKVAPVGPATSAPPALRLSLTSPSAPNPAPAAATAPAAAAPSSSGGYVLQIGAYKRQAEADVAWKVYKAKHAALLAGATPDVQQADLGDKGIWYRLRIAGFLNKDVASAMCDRLKADGSSCFLSK